MIDLNWPTAAREQALREVVTLHGAATFADAAAVLDQSTTEQLVMVRGSASLTDGTAPATSTPTTLNVVVLGDSTTDGLHEWVFRLIETWVDRYTDWFTWTSLVNPNTKTSPLETVGYISAGASTRVVNVWNCAFGGAKPSDYTPTELARFITDPDPDIVIFSLGLNEGAPSLVGNLAALVDSVQALVPDAQLVVTSQNPLSSDSGAPDRRNVVQAEAAASGGLFVDAYQAFINYGDWESLLIDGIHPNAEGSQLWADFWNRRTALGVSTIELVRNSAPGQRPRVDSTVKTAAATATKKEASIS